MSLEQYLVKNDFIRLFHNWSLDNDGLMTFLEVQNDFENRNHIVEQLAVEYGWHQYLS